jgi:hypothetical protein
MKLLLFLVLAKQPDKLPTTVIKVCGACHAPEAVLNTNNTRQGWTELVDEMIFKGAKATPRERRQIIDYLARNFPMRL